MMITTISTRAANTVPHSTTTSILKNSIKLSNNHSVSGKNISHKSSAATINSDQARTFLTLHHFKSYTPAVEIITDSKDPRLTDIYLLRYNVSVKQAKTSAFTDDHPHVKDGCMIVDELDSDESTIHYAIRDSSGRVVAAMRTVNAVNKKGGLEMMKENWFHPPQELLDEGAVEFCRLVADKSIRGTNGAPILCLQAFKHAQDMGIRNVIATVNASESAEKVLKHYRNYAKMDSLTDSLNNGPVHRNDNGLKGHMCHVLNIPMGKNGSIERSVFNLSMMAPAKLGIMFMKDYLRIGRKKIRGSLLSSFAAQ